MSDLMIVSKDEQSIREDLIAAEASMKTAIAKEPKGSTYDQAIDKAAFTLLWSIPKILLLMLVELKRR